MEGGVEGGGAPLARNGGVAVGLVDGDGGDDKLHDVRQQPGQEVPAAPKRWSTLFGPAAPKR